MHWGATWRKPRAGGHLHLNDALEVGVLLAWCGALTSSHHAGVWYPSLIRLDYGIMPANASKQVPAALDVVDDPGAPPTVTKPAGSKWPPSDPFQRTWSTAVPSAARCVRVSIANTGQPWMPDHTCLVALNALHDAMLSHRDTVLEELADAVASIELPATLDMPAASISLYRCLCLLRVITSCLFYEWKHHQSDETLRQRQSGLWSDPAPLHEALVQRLLTPLLSHMEHLNTYERAWLMHRHLQNRQALSPETDRGRTLPFRHREGTEASLRERECDTLFAQKDAHKGVYVATASAHAYFVLYPAFPAHYTAFSAASQGMSMHPTLWNTPADALDATPRTISAHVYRAVSHALLYISAANWDATMRLLGPLSAMRTEGRAFECLHWTWSRLVPLLQEVIRDVGSVSRQALCFMGVSLRRIVHVWLHYHTEERRTLPPNVAVDAILPTFHALHTLAEGPYRRPQLWPTLAALVAVAPPLFSTPRARREQQTKMLSWLDTLLHHVQHARLGVSATYALVLVHDMASYGRVVMPAPYSQTLLQRWQDTLSTLTIEDIRLVGQALIASFRADARVDAVRLVQLCVAEKPSYPSLLVVAYALVQLLCEYREDRRWMDVLYPRCAPVLRRVLRSIVRTWLTSQHMSEMGHSLLHAILFIAVLDPDAVFAHMPPSRPGELDTLPLPFSGPVLDTALQADTRVSFVLALVCMPGNLAHVHAASLAALQRISGGLPSATVLSRFVFMPPSLLTSRQPPCESSKRVLRLLAPYDAQVAETASRRVMQAGSRGAQLYWLVSLQTAATRALHSHAPIPTLPAMAAVVFGLCMPNKLVVRTAQETARVFSESIQMPMPIPVLLERMPTLVQICSALRAISPPNAVVAMAWSGWLQWAYASAQAAPPQGTVRHEDLMHVAQVLVASAKLGLYGVSYSSDMLLIRTVSHLLLGATSTHDIAHVLLEAVPTTALPLVLQQVYASSTILASMSTTTASSNELIDTALRLLEVLIPRMDIIELSENDLHRVVQLCVLCMRHAHRPAARRIVCRAVMVVALSDCEALQVVQPDLLDGILPWGLQVPQLRRHVLAAIEPLLRRWTPHLSEWALRIHESASEATMRRTARVVDQILHIACLENDADLSSFTHDPHTMGRTHNLAVEALYHVLRQNLPFLARELVQLLTRSEPIARYTVMLAMARVVSSPSFTAAVEAAVPPPPTTSEVLLSHDTQWLVGVLARSTMADVPLWEQALAGFLTAAQWRRLLAAVVREEVQACTSENLLLRANTTTLRFLSVYARRIAYVQVQAVVRDMLTFVSTLPDSALDLDWSLDGPVPMSVRQHDTAMRLIAALTAALVTFIHTMPIELHCLCMDLYYTAVPRYGELSASRALGVFLCLRVLGPAVATPSSVEVAVPTPGAQRALRFLNKVLVALPQGRFSAYRDAACTSVNSAVGATTAFLDRVLRVASERRVYEPPPTTLTWSVPHMFHHLLRGRLEPLAQAGDAIATQVLASMPLARSLSERVALVLGQQDQEQAYTSFMQSMAAEPDASEASDMFFEVQGETQRTFLVLYTSVDMIHIDILRIARYMLSKVSPLRTPWTLVLDLSGTSDRHLLQLQFSTLIVTLMPREAFRHLHTLTVLHGSYAMLQYGWTLSGATTQSPFIARRQAEGGPPLHIDWISGPSDYGRLSDHVRASLPVFTQRLLAARPTFQANALTLDDGRRFPEPAVLITTQDHVLLRTIPARHDGMSRPSTCDIIPLGDLVLDSDHVSYIRLLRRSCASELYVRTRECVDILHALRRAQMRHDNYAPGVHKPISLPEVRAALTGMGLFHRTASQWPLRSAADTLLRALDLLSSTPVAMYTPPIAPSFQIPAPLQAGALTMVLDLAACLGQHHVHMSGLAGLMDAVPVSVLPCLMRMALSLWLVHPNLRLALQSMWQALASQPTSILSVFLEACLDSTPTSPSMVMHAVQDAVLAAAVPALHHILMARINAMLTSALRPGAWHRLQALVALHAVQCSVPSTPLEQYLPDIVTIILLFAHGGSQPLHHAAHVTLVNTLAAWPVPSIMADVEEAMRPSSDAPLERLLALVHSALRAMAPTPTTYTAWCEALERKVQAVALTSDGIMQARALHLWAYVATPSPAMFRTVGGVLLAAYPHAPVTVAAAASCWARLCQPSMAPCLFWAGMALIAGGAATGGVQLAQAALDALPKDRTTLDLLLRTRHNHLAYLGALEAELGVSFERDFSLAAATVLRVPLWSGDPTLEAATRVLVQHLSNLVPSTWEAPSSTLPTIMPGVPDASLWPATFVPPSSSSFTSSSHASVPPLHSPSHTLSGLDLLSSTDSVDQTTAALASTCLYEPWDEEPDPMSTAPLSTSPSHSHTHSHSQSTSPLSPSQRKTLSDSHSSTTLHTVTTMHKPLRSLVHMSYADSLLPHANDTQMQTLLSILSESDPKRDHVLTSPVHTHFALTPFDQLSLVGLQRPEDTIFAVAECQAWLRHVLDICQRS